MSKTVLILGASGRISKQAIPLFLDTTNFELVLYLRDKTKLADLNLGDRCRIIEGDVRNEETLKSALEGIDVVFASLTADIDLQVRAIVECMEEADVKRLIYVSSLGIYDEVPGEFGEWNSAMIGALLPAYRRAADVIELSDLAYTILRPAWLTDNDEIDYETTDRATLFKGTEVSRRSVAALVVEIAKDPSLHVRDSVGVNKPNTDGPYPHWLDQTSTE